MPFPKVMDAPSRVAEALAWPCDLGLDKAWYERRQQAGEASEIEAGAERLALEVDALLDAFGAGTWEAEGAESARGRLVVAGDGKGCGDERDGGAPLEVDDREPVGLILSPALRPIPILCPRASRNGAGEGEGANRGLVAAGPGVSAELLVLGVLAMPVARALEERFARASHEARRLGALMVAGSRLVAMRPPDEVLEPVLEAVVRELFPPQHRQEELERLVRALVPELDQPPGEIERAIRGMGRRRADRVHRAWLRGFFVPRGLRIAGLEEAAAAASAGGVSEAE